MPRGGKGLLWHMESYEGPDTPFRPGVYETPTLTCYHCGVVVVLNPDRTRPREWCFNCDSYICDPCKAVSVAVGCHPIAQALELMRQYPGRVSIARSKTGEIMGDELALAQATKPYQGITLIGRDS